MIRPRRRNAVAAALWANAALLGGILIVLLARGGGSSSLFSAAFAQQQPPIAGGGGVFVMPCQLSSNVWGCYLLDIDAQTIVVYQYVGGKLRFVAARHYQYDRHLRNFSTEPLDSEIKRWVEKEQQGLRQGDENVKPPDPEKPATNN